MNELDMFEFIKDPDNIHTFKKIKSRSKITMVTYSEIMNKNELEQFLEHLGSFLKAYKDMSIFVEIRYISHRTGEVPKKSHIYKIGNGSVHDLNEPTPGKDY
jgi:hypothetical protein